MNDTINFLKKIKNDTKQFKVANDILDKLDYRDAESKKIFLDKLRQKDFVYYQVTGSIDEIYVRSEYNEVIGFNENAKPFTFSVKITEKGQNHLSEHLSKEETRRHNKITRWIAGTAALLTLCSLLWNIYQSTQVGEMKTLIKKMETRIDLLQTKLILLDSTVISLKVKPSKGKVLHNVPNNPSTPKK